MISSKRIFRCFPVAFILILIVLAGHFVQMTGDVGPVFAVDSQHTVGSDMSDQFATVYETERLRLLGDYDVGQMSYAVGTPDNGLSHNHTAYIDRLTLFVDEYFDGSPHQPHLYRMLSDLALHLRPPSKQPMPKVVRSTCKGGKADAPEDFAAWEKRLPDWQVEVADDAMMESWFNESTAGTGAGVDKFGKVWKSLPKPVLKTDWIR
jgi:hypothetical protein